MANLFDIYGDQESSGKSGKVNLFETYKDEEPTAEEETGTPLEIARKRIKKQYPDMPEWVREGILKITPQAPSPRLEAAGNEAQKYIDFISPSIGGALQGASLPIRGVSGLIPTEFTQNLSNAPDLRSLFQAPKTQNQRNVQATSELLGGAGGFGKLFQGLSAANKALKVPKMLQTPLSLAETGAIGTPGEAEERSIGAGGALASGGLWSVAGKVAKKAPELIRGLFNKPNPEEVTQLIQKAHDKQLFEAEEAYGVAKNAIKKRGINFKDQNKIGDHETFESGDIFGVTANPENTVIPNNKVAMADRGDGRAVVIGSEVKDKGKGIGKSLYKSAINEAEKRGLKFESDDVVSEQAMNVYKSLEKDGYKFEFNPKVEKIKLENGSESYRSLDDDKPVVKLISSPEKHGFSSLIDKAEDIFAKTRPNRKLIQQARSGDYEAIHDLQSKLFKQGTKSLASEDPAIINQGEEILDLRNNLLDEMEKHLTKEGHADIVQTLRAARKTYANLKNTFFGKNLKKAIGKMVHPDTRLVPENPLDLFKENSVPMKEFIKKFPEIGKHLKSEKEREAAMKALKALGWTSAGVTGTKTVYDLFK